MDWIEKVEEEIGLLQQDNERLRELLRRARVYIPERPPLTPSRDFAEEERLEKLHADITEALGPC